MPLHISLNVSGGSLDGQDLVATYNFLDKYAEVIALVKDLRSCRTWFDIDMPWLGGH